jgi:CheY-like chemotaxis protein
MANVMIVDDDTDSAAMLAKFLGRRGHLATCMPNGIHALAEIIRATPDVLILSLPMPAMDGLSLLEVLRRHLSLKSLPVVVLTGVPEGPTVDRARKAGVSSIVVTASFKDIEAAVRAALPR